MDPPYGVKFGSNWQVSTRRKRRDRRRVPAMQYRQPEQVKAFRDTWDVGVHSYLEYLRDRLCGVHEVYLPAVAQSFFKSVMRTCTWCAQSWMRSSIRRILYLKLPSRKPVVNSTTALPAVFDYILWYARDKPSLKYRQLFSSKTRVGRERSSTRGPGGEMNPKPMLRRGRRRSIHGPHFSRIQWSLRDRRRTIGPSSGTGKSTSRRRIPTGRQHAMA